MLNRFAEYPSIVEVVCDLGLNAIVVISITMSGIFRIQTRHKQTDIPVALGRLFFWESWVKARMDAMAAAAAALVPLSLIPSLVTAIVD